jgi:hypothetical protein
MASTDTGTPTPPKVERLATETAHLPRTALIGIFGQPSAPSALVLLPNGETQTVTIGARLSGGTVEAIGDDLLVIAKRGGTSVLRMPRG